MIVFIYVRGIKDVWHLDTPINFPNRPNRLRKTEEFVAWTAQKRDGVKSK